MNSMLALVSLLLLVACGSPAVLVRHPVFNEVRDAEILACRNAGTDRCRNIEDHGTFQLAEGYHFVDTDCDRVREVLDNEQFSAFQAALEVAWNQPAGWTPPPSNMPSCMPIKF